MESFHIPDQLEAVTTDIDKGRRHPVYELLQQLIVLRIPGGEAVSDAALLAESATAALFQQNAVTIHISPEETVTIRCWSLMSTQVSWLTDT